MATTVRGRGASGKRRATANHCLRFCLRVTAIWLLICGPSVASSATSYLTNEEFVSVNGAGVRPNAIVAKLESAKGQFWMDLEGLIKLAGAGVDNWVESAIVRTGSSTARTEAQQAVSEYFGLLLSAVGTVLATLLGVIVAFWLTGIRERDSKTFELVRLYQTTFGLHGKVLCHLDNWSKTSTPSDDEQNEIRLMGNWMNTMAALIVRKRVDVRLVDDLVIREDIKFFGNKVFSNPTICKQLDADGWKFIKSLTLGDKA